jgi:integrase-like protein
LQSLQTDDGLYAVRVRPVIVGYSTAPPAQVAINIMSDGCSLADGSGQVAGETWVAVRTAGPACVLEAESRQRHLSHIWFSADNVDTTMKAEDVTATLDMALEASGVDQARLLHRPRLLSDGSSYISDDLAKWMKRHDMAHVRGAPYHPMTQGKIERWHQTLKSRILLENYYLPGDLQAQIEIFVTDYNHRRHESIDNLTSADVYFGRGQTILLKRERIKRKTIQNRRLLHRRQAA